MIARQYRFHGYNALKFVYKQGRTVRSPTCLLRYALNAQRRHARVAVVVAKKVSKSAVVRNRIRRRIFTAVRSEAGRVGIAGWESYDLVFTVTDNRIAEMSEKSINEIIFNLLQTSGIISRPVDK